MGRVYERLLPFVNSVALDESNGTRTGCDLLYADTNFNGEFEESERYVSTAAKRHGAWLAFSSFPPVDLNLPYNESAEGIKDPCQVSLGYRQYPRHGVAEEISIMARFTFGCGGGARYSVGIPEGDYLVEATVDTGPLAGLLTRSMSIRFDGKRVAQ
ncbi:hypothetical protein HQ563_13450 [bacterium]|nr:hypothetical protein [bacterium]